MDNPSANYNCVANKQWVDALIAISCFGVVCLHANSIFWARPTGFSWFTALAIECLFYFAVPIFYMISGYTLLGYRKRYSTKTFLCRRFKRTVIPYVFWSLLAYFVLSIIQGGGYNGINTGARLLAALVNAQIVGVYWFFPPLFICYLLVPLFGLACNSKNFLLYLLMLGLVSHSLLPFISQILGVQILSIYLNILPGGGYIVFFILGFVLGNYRISVKVENMILLLGLIGLVAHFIGTHYCSPAGAEIGKLFKGYLNWPALLYGSAVFLLIKRLYDTYDLSFLGNVIAFVRRNSFGIYLLHWWILYIIVPKIFKMAPLAPSLRENAMVNILLAILTTIFCGLITEAIRQIKMVRWVIGE